MVRKLILLPGGASSPAGRVLIFCHHFGGRDSLKKSEVSRILPAQELNNRTLAVHELVDSDF